jgi:hypothetical protein
VRAFSPRSFEFLHFGYTGSIQSSSSAEGPLGFDTSRGPVGRYAVRWWGRQRGVGDALRRLMRQAQSARTVASLRGAEVV